jgi:SAM-dependent methyltransferase
VRLSGEDPGLTPGLTARPTIGSASHRATNDKAFELITGRLTPRSKVLDLGAGRGHLARRVAAWIEANGGSPREQLVAADLADGEFEAREVPFRQLDLNQPLPFPPASFDLVYSIEVFEHLHRPYDTLQECHRVLRPGGSLVLSTPNILHLHSRLRFLLTGFHDLYQPPSADPANAARLCGHVMPLHLAYYAYGLRRAGFEPPQLARDRIKRSAVLLAVLLYPLLAFGRWRFLRGIRRYDAAVYAETRDILERANSFGFYTARSLMLAARKPAA